MWYITLPGISGTIAFILILRVAHFLGSDVEQIILMYNPLVYSVGDTIGTYVYREGLLNQSFSYTTAVGLFTSVISLVLILVANKISLRFTDRGVW